MDEKRRMLRHFLATLAYRTRKSLELSICELKHEIMRKAVNVSLHVSHKDSCFHIVERGEVLVDQYVLPAKAYDPALYSFK